MTSFTIIPCAYLIHLLNVLSSFILIYLNWRQRSKVTPFCAPTWAVPEYCMLNNSELAKKEWGTLFPQSLKDGQCVKCDLLKKEWAQSSPTAHSWNKQCCNYLQSWLHLVQPGVTFFSSLAFSTCVEAGLSPHLANRSLGAGLSLQKLHAGLHLSCHLHKSEVLLN
jgi:hypothetical protein